MDGSVPSNSADAEDSAKNSGEFLTTQTTTTDEASSADMSGQQSTERDADAASMKSDDDAMSETGKSTCSSHPFSSPNPSEQDDGDPHGAYSFFASGFDGFYE